MVTNELNARGGVKVVSEGLTVTAPLIFGIFLRGVRKIGYFCGGRQEYCVSTFDLFSFLLELIRHSDLAFQMQRKGTSVCGV